MHFIDEVDIHVKAGDGGNGAIAFRREKFVPTAAPRAATAATAARVVFVADEGLSTLLDFRYQRIHGAGGEHGADKDQYGAAATTSSCASPSAPGLRRRATRRAARRSRPGERVVVAQGGKGGRGNIHFATSTDRRRATPSRATPGEERKLRLELKLLADVGLLGYPNVGKSTFIAASRAPARRSPTTRSPRWCPTSASSALSDERSVRDRRHPRPHRGRARGRGARAPLPAPRRAHPRAAPPARRVQRRARARRRSHDYDAINPSSPATTPSSRRARRSWRSARSTCPTPAGATDADRCDVRRARRRAARASARRPAKGCRSCWKLWPALPPRVAAVDSSLLAGEVLNIPAVGDKSLTRRSD